jgi:hypothetical protein
MPDHDYLGRFDEWGEENDPIVFLGDHSNRQLLADLHLVVVFEPGRGPKGYGQKDPADPDVLPNGPRSGAGPYQDPEFPGRR